MSLGARFLLTIVLTTLSAVSGTSNKAGAAGSPDRAIRADTTPLRVLFIGNSYTYYNNLPGTTETLARAGSCRLDAHQVTMPGGMLSQLWRSGVAVDSIRNGRWDFVVVQEQSLLGGLRVDGEPVIGSPDTFFEYARRFQSEITRAGARLVLFHTWARAGHADDQRMLDYAYFSIGRELGAVVAPVGVAWVSMLGSNPDLTLHLSDGSHPNGLGTYLTATVIAQSVCGKLRGKPPTVVAADSINERGQFVAGQKTAITVPAELAGRLREAAENAVARVRAAGGYLAVEPSHAAALPQPPTAGKTPTHNELVGTWQGEIRLNVPGSMRVTFIGNTTTHASGSAQVRIGSTILERPLESLAVADGLISFAIPLDGQGEFRFAGAFSEGAIHGVGGIAFGSRTTALGRVVLTRVPGAAAVPAIDWVNEHTTVGGAADTAFRKSRSRSGSNVTVTLRKSSARIRSASGANQRFSAAASFNSAHP